MLNLQILWIYGLIFRYFGIYCHSLFNPCTLSVSITIFESHAWVLGTGQHHTCKVWLPRQRKLLYYSKIDFQLFETSHNQQQLPHFQKHCLHVCCTTTWTRDNKQKTYWELRGHQAPSLLDYYTSIQKLGAARP